MADFPAIRPGILTQRPYTVTRSFWNTTVIMPSGLKFAWKHRDVGVEARKLTYASITDSEVAILEAFFRARGGRLEAFDFRDPDTDVVYRMCFDQDDLVMHYIGPDENSCDLLLVEVLAP